MRKLFTIIIPVSMCLASCATLPPGVQTAINKLCTDRVAVAEIIALVEKTPGDPIARQTLDALNIACPLVVIDARATLPLTGPPVS